MPSSSKSFFEIIRRVGLQPYKLVLLIFLSALSSASEALGLAFMLPIGELMVSGKDVETLSQSSQIWHYLQQLFNTIGLEITVPTLLVISLSLITLRQVGTFFMTIFTVILRENVVLHVRNEVVHNFYRASLEHQESLSVGEVVNHLTTELMRMILAIQSIISLYTNLIFALVYASILFGLSWKMATGLLVVGCVGYVFIRGFMSKTVLEGKRLSVFNAQINKLLSDHLRLARLIKLTGTEKNEEEFIGKSFKNFRDSVLNLSKLTASTSLIIEPIGIFTGFALLYIGHEILQMSIVKVGLFLVILLRVLPIAKPLALTWQSYLSNRGCMATIIALLENSALNREEDEGKYNLTSLSHGIEFRNVTYSYAGPSGVPAINNLSVFIEAGSFVALVGPSGGGKSTFVDLIPRLRVVNEGDIIFDDTSIQDITIKSLRNFIAYVPQTPQILDVSAAEHIRYGKKDASDEEVVIAAKLAGADDFIRELPEGYETKLGVEGLRLSGGQRQRLDLARALVANRPILILDEPTSNLDAVSEQLFKKSISKMKENGKITVIMIAHRLSTVHDADKILVLINGQLEAAGTSEELTKTNEWYQNAVSEHNLKA